MILRRFTIALILLLVPLFAKADDAPARILSETVTLHVDRDGRVTRHVRQELRLNSFATVRALGEWFYSYNPALEDVRIIESLTIRKDGTQVPMPANAMLDLTPAAVENAPDFSQLRERMVSHTGLEPGCTVRFEYETTDRKPHRSVLLEPMGGRFPIDEKTVTLKLDGNHRVIPNGALATTGPNTYAVHHTASIRGHAPFTSDSILPGILVVIDPPENRIRQAVRHAPSPKERAALWKALDCTPDTPDVEVERRLSILLRETLDTVTVHPNLVGWSIRPLDRVVASGYATNLEKAAIAWSVLSAIGEQPTLMVADDPWSGIIAGRHPMIMVIGAMTWFPDVPHEPVQGFIIGSNSVNPKLMGPAMSITIEAACNNENTLTGTVTASLSGTAVGMAVPRVWSGVAVSDKEKTTLQRSATRSVITATLSGTLPSDRMETGADILEMLHLQSLFHATLDATHVVVNAPVDLDVRWKLTGLDKSRWITPPPVHVKEPMGTSSIVWSNHPDRLSGTMTLHLSAGSYSGRSLQQLRHLLGTILDETNRTVVRLE